MPFALTKSTSSTTRPSATPLSAATTALFNGMSARALWFATGGLAIALTGALNLLRQAYGEMAPGVRRVAVAANGALVVFAIAGGITTAASTAQWAIMGVLTAGPGILSILRSAQVPAPASPAASPSF